MAVQGLVTGTCLSAFPSWSLSLASEIAGGPGPSTENMPLVAVPGSSELGGEGACTRGPESQPLLEGCQVYTAGAGGYHAPPSPPPHNRPDGPQSWWCWAHLREEKLKEQKAGGSVGHRTGQREGWDRSPVPTSLPWEPSG